MKKNVIIRLFALVLVGSYWLSCKETNQQKKEIASIKEEVMPEKLLRHVVLFKFKDEAPKEEVEKLNDMFNTLPTSIPEIKDFEWGLNDSPEDFHQGFTHCYLVTFSSEKDRDSVYAPHPKHQEFVAALQPHLEKVFVVDYWTN
ncbi:Dabb family protein [Spongiivirga sp. MCCC 1A20706]|uniref:Dabb family protein n=1 Tax=Spongiivirga sp. MCCC 1A20706 TaxID=3160963 RepID=UPI0039779F68